jgi:DNA-binding CsgD family transcriptional regulator
MYDLIEHLGVGVVAQRDARLVFANAFFAQLLRYETPSSLLGRSVWDIVHPDGQDELRDRLKACLLGDDSAYLSVLATAAGEPEPVCSFPRLVRGQRSEDDESKSPLLVEMVIPLRLLQNVPGLRVLPETGFLSKPGPTSAVREAPTAMALGAEQFQQLTQREVEVVEGLTGGLPISQLAKQLEISPNTVRNHLKSIFRKLNVRSQTELLSRLLVKTRGGGR